MKKDTQQKARMIVREYLDAHVENGKDFARRCDVARATFYRFVSGDDVSMTAVEKILAGIGYSLDVIKTDADVSV